MTKASEKTLLKLVKSKFNRLLRFLPFRVHGYLAIGIILAVLIRLIFVPNQSLDYKYFLEPWYDFIASHGGFSALKYSFADYTPPLPLLDCNFCHLAIWIAKNSGNQAFCNDC